MNSPYIHERRRIMDPAKKVKFSQLVRESNSLEEAAEWLDVSIRTVQRERKRDEDFDHEVRLAQQATPDPLRLMENAARTHWRAAAWLLERTRPEQFARKPANTARDYQVEAALGMLLEAALAATAPAERAAFYQQVEPACGQALQYCFPQLGPNGNLKKSNLPPTPLADETSRQVLRAEIAAYQAQAQAAAPLSPKTHEATASNATAAPRSHAPRGNATPDAPRRAPRHDAAPATPRLAGQEAGSILDAERREERSHAERGNENADDNLSPKTHEATAVVSEPPVAIDYNLPIDFNLRYDDFAAAIGVLGADEQSLLWNQRLRHHAALKRRQERQAVKRQKAAKKRSATSRRRNAA